MEEHGKAQETAQLKRWKEVFFFLHILWAEKAGKLDVRWEVVLKNLSEILEHDPHISFSSSHKQMLEHPAFLLMEEIGYPIIPWVFKQYATEEGHGWWCPMLLFKFFKDEKTVVPKEHAGNYKLIREDWLKWGKEKAFI